MTGILTLLGLLLGLLHLVGGFVAFVWLLFLGEWSTLGVGLLAVLLAGLIIRVALLPGLWLFGTPAAILRQGPRRNLARPFYALIGANTVVVMGAWCLFWAWTFLSRAEHDTRVPLLLWAYAVSVVPWIRIARKSAREEAVQTLAERRDPEVVDALSVTYLVQLAFICGGIAWLGGWTSFQMAALPLWCLALVLMATATVRQQEAPRKRQGVQSMARPGAATIDGEGGVSPNDRDRHEG